MKHTLLMLLLSVMSVCAQNLLNNPDFSDVREGIPLDWKTNAVLSGEETMTLLPGGGPNGENAMRLRMKNTVVFGQGGLTLVTGEK